MNDAVLAADQIANTYLSAEYGGGQSGGGGGTTVLKRTLKLLSHTVPRQLFLPVATPILAGQ